MNVKKKKNRGKKSGSNNCPQTYGCVKTSLFPSVSRGSEAHAKLLEGDWHSKYLSSLFFSEVLCAPPHTSSLLLYLTPFVAIFHSPFFSFAAKTGIMQEVMGCGSGRKEIRMLLDSHPVLLRSGAKQFQGGRQV